MKTRYVNFLIEGTAKAIERRTRHGSLVDGMFDQELLKPREDARAPLFRQRQQLAQKAALRRVNQSPAERVAYLFYAE
jgi:hypothetical protein